MKKKVPIYKLREPERLWIQEVYKDFLDNKRSNHREIWARLYGKIPANFRPAGMDYRLISADGERLTLLGIIAIEKNLEVLQEVNTVVNAIKQTLLENPNQESFTMDEIAGRTGINNIRVGLMFSLISYYGKFWTSGSAFTNNGIALKSIDIGRDSNVYYQYIRFDNIEELIILYLNEEEFNRSKDESYVNDLAKFNKIESKEEYITVKPIFNRRIKEISPRLCFTLMPFGKSWSDRVYKDYIRRNVESLKLQCLRADKLTGQNIVEDIWGYINQAAFIIADVTDTNANVMYELGIAHTLGKPTILITQDVSKIPFDFRHLRHIEYADNLEGAKVFNKEIKRFIKELYKEQYPEMPL